jgi:hypothetical protein
VFGFFTFLVVCRVLKYNINPIEVIVKLKPMSAYIADSLLTGLMECLKSKRYATIQSSEDNPTQWDRLIKPTTEDPSKLDKVFRALPRTEAKARRQLHKEERPSEQEYPQLFNEICNGIWLTNRGNIYCFQK